jgi:uncharacterized lipoprotein YmbA
MKRYLLVLICVLLVGCASQHITVPTMDLPLEPIKPEIHSKVIVQGNDAYLAYSVPDSLKLYEFLLQQKNYEEKLRFRIEIMNQILTGK